MKSNIHRYIKKVFVLLVAFMGTSLIISPSVLAASPYIWTNDTTGTSLSGHGWYVMNKTSSGQYVYASDSLHIYVSSNYGANFINTTGSGGLGSTTNSFSVASGGTYALAAEENGDLWVSSNNGSSWTDVTPSGPLSDQDWFETGISGNGQYMAAALGSGDIYVSTNYGQNWALKKSVSVGALYNMAVSQSGQYMTAIAYGGDIYTSSDYGSTWTANSNAGSNGWWFNSMSDSGQYQLATTDNLLYISNDYGATWSQSSAPANNYVYVDSSSTGQYLVAADGGGGLYESMDYGSTWTDITAGTSMEGLNWATVSISGTGQYIFAGVGGGDVYTGNDPALAPATPIVTVSAKANDPADPDTGYGVPRDMTLVSAVLFSSLLALSAGLYISKKQTD